MRLIPSIALSGLVLALSGCGGSRSSPAGRQYFVAFSQCNNAEPYRAAQNALMTKLFAKQPNVRLVIADGQQDNSRQVGAIEAFLRQKPDLLIVAPNERAPLTEVMGRAYRAGIPVICLERDILEPNYTTWIRSDNRRIGRMAGKFIVDHLTKKNGSPRGSLVEIRGLLGVEGEINRYGGARDVLAKYPGIQVVHEAVADWIQSKAKDRMTEALRAQPNIDVVYAHNDPMAVGAYLAARELGREKQIIFVGVDGLGGPGGGIRKVMDGVLAATFVYPLCVDKAVEIGMRILTERSFRPEKTYTMDTVMVTPANAPELLKQYTID